MVSCIILHNNYTFVVLTGTCTFFIIIIIRVDAHQQQTKAQAESN